MSEFRDAQAALSQFRFRIAAAGALVLICFAVLLVRFFWLQAVRYNHYALAAEDNRIAIVPIVPNRGLILDRNAVVLAQNYSAYTLEINPSKISQDLESLINELGKVVEIYPRDRKRFKKQLDESKNFETLPIRTLLSDEEVARFAAQRYRFAGVEIRARLFRQYPLGELASHVVGYIGRMSVSDRERLEDASDVNDERGQDFDSRIDIANYRGTDYVGKVGVEQSYETTLHGITGFEEVEVSAGGRAVRALSSTPATPGDNLILSLDARLQYLVEHLFGDRRGAFVAIEPATGDVLAFVSKPTFDPNLFVEGIDSETWKSLNEAPSKPLFNRPLKGTYSPGSTYKPFMALAALSTGKRTPEQSIADPGYFMFGNHQFRDDKVGGHGIVDMYRSIVQSCDTYYYILARDLGVSAMHDFMKPFGFGQITGIDIIGEARGVLPSPEWKRAVYRKAEQQKWYPGETISLGIGQGYNSFTILQMAAATANLANRGVVMQPHVVRVIEDAVTRAHTLTTPKESYRIPLLPAHIDLIHQAMVGVNKEGTGARAFTGAKYISAGKTGTAQLFSIAQGQKYHAGKTQEHLRDNALFIGFAPADKPKIAFALVVENNGFGAQAAAPIARQVLDYMLEGTWPSNVPPLMTANEKNKLLASAPPQIDKPKSADVVDPAVMLVQALSSLRKQAHPRVSTGE
ncbi:MAG: penicillin-binding protein 2 [Ottowia sp.]|nr:penicillin-binding protein 2 [Ottowia sp.]